MIKQLAAIAIVLAALPAHADKAAADAAFEEAKRLAAAGKLVEACPKFEVSYNEDPQLGSLLNLADCHERVGRLATARAEFRTAVELAHQRKDARESYAAARASKLDPQIAHLVLHRKAGIEGLHVKLDDRDVTAMVDVDLPIDSGHHVIATTSATGTWSSDLEIESDGAHRELTVPNGDETPTPVAVTAPLPQEQPVSPITRPLPDDDGADARHRRHVIAMAVGGVGIATAAVGLVIGHRTYVEVDRSRQDGHCTGTTAPLQCDMIGASALDAANTDATASDVLVGIGAAAIVAAAVVWFTAPSERVSVTPIASSTAIGGSIAIKF